MKKSVMDIPLWKSSLHVIIINFIFCLIFIIGPKVYAAENITGAWTSYNKAAFHSVMSSGYDSTYNMSFPTQTYQQIPAVNYVDGNYTIFTQMQLQPVYNFTSGTYYTLKFRFDFGSYIYPVWPNNNSQSWFFTGCPGSNCTLSYQWQGDSTHQATSYLDLTINFKATSNSSNALFTIGNTTDNLGTFYNSYNSQQGIRISSATIDSSSSSGGNQDIIDNDNQNTQNIINNNNQNTTNIINNQNENTEKQIESQKVCSQIDLSSGISEQYLNNNGSLIYSEYWKLTDFIKITSNDTLTVLQGYTFSSGTPANLCFYNVNKSLISCIANSTLTSNQIINIPSSANFVRFSINTFYNQPQYSLCRNGNQALSDDINDLNNTLKDDNLPDVINSGGGGGTYFDDINQSSDTPISDLLLLPLNIYNKIKTSLNTSCSAYTIPFDFTGGNNTLTLPCLNLEDHLGSSLWSIIDGLFCIFMIYNIFNLCVSTYDSITNLDDLFPYFHHTSYYAGSHEPGQYAPRHGGWED